MSSTHYKLTITNPCDNDWEKMTPVSGGRFCDACSKNVVDFTTQSEAQIKDYFRAHASEKICGRLYMSQIDKIKIEFDKDILHSDIRFWQKFLVVLLVCFGSELLGVDFCIAQTDSLTSATVQVDTLRSAETCDSLVADQAPENNSLKHEASILPVAISLDPFLHPYITDIVVSGGIGYNPFEQSGGLVCDIAYTEFVFVKPEPTADADTISEKPVEPVVPATSLSLDEGQPVPKPNEPVQERMNLFVLEEPNKKRRRRKKIS